MKIMAHRHMCKMSHQNSAIGINNKIVCYCTTICNPYSTKGNHSKCGKNSSRRKCQLDISQKKMVGQYVQNYIYVLNVSKSIYEKDDRFQICELLIF